ncbi:MAG: TrkH family potassium uptake protein [Acidimicrobiales bacterium]|nr:TrkH family potassium uptake protein [Acidimicrobiales bacterium]
MNPLSQFPFGNRWKSTTASVLGMALLFVAVGMTMATLVALVDGADALALATASGITALIGAGLFHVATPGPQNITAIFSAVGTTWVTTSVLGALPYLLAGTFAVAGQSWVVVLADALFESVSGFSTSGSTVFGAHNPIEAQGAGILLYRHLTQWAGGMGIVVLVVMVLPSLRSSGLGLIDAEAPGMGVDRLAPRIKTIATRFWSLYLGFTVAVAASLFVAGMGPFDAVAHAFSTASTGGFSTKDASIGHWDSIAIEVVVVLAMIIGGASFALHNNALRQRKFGYFRDPEFRTYAAVLGAAVGLVVVFLVGDQMGVVRAFRSAVFNVVTFGTSSGFSNATGAGTAGDFALWAAGPQLVLLLLMVFGGCTGSTSGGVKVIRLRVGMAYAYRTLLSLRQPRALFTVRLGSTPISESMVERIAGFMVVYGLLVVGGTIVIAALGVDLVSAFGGVISALGNTGLTLGEAGPTASYADAYPTTARMVLAVLMLVGRLEIFPMLLMLVAPYRSFAGVARGIRTQLR